jgi:hypothetical protein
MIIKANNKNNGSYFNMVHGIVYQQHNNLFQDRVLMFVNEHNGILKTQRCVDVIQTIL